MESIKRKGEILRSFFFFAYAGANDLKYRAKYDIIRQKATEPNLKNVFHYVKKYGKNDFNELVFSTSDAFTLSALAYAHFERVERDFDEIATVSALWKKYLACAKAFKSDR